MLHRVLGGIFFAFWFLFFGVACQHEKVTFAEDIAPIIHRNCTPCHRPGEAGPFSLITYADVRRKAATIAEVTTSGLMPPWPADPAYRTFGNQRILTSKEKELFRLWVKQGALPGDTANMPSAPHFPEGSQLGEPDLVIEMQEAIPLQGNMEDRFLVVKLPFEIDRDTFVRAIEFVPGNRKLVHHMNGHLIGYRPDKKANVFEPPFVLDSSYSYDRQSIFKKLSLLNDDGTFPAVKPLVSSYLPGVTGVIYPEGIGGFRLPKKGAFIFNDIHYGPSPVDTSDRSRLNVFFSNKPPARPLLELQLGTLGVSDIIPPLVIPPDTVMTFFTRGKVLGDLSLLSINPHMHLLGKSFLAFAIDPNRDTIPLIKIPEWDFRWQYYYHFDYPLKLPAGTEIHVYGVFDNTSANPNNPYQPPRTISEKDGSMKTTDEMFQFILMFVPYQKGDENISMKNIGLLLPDS